MCYHTSTHPTGASIHADVAANPTRVYQAMMTQTLSTSDNPSLKALSYILEAWEQGAEAGVKPELMAYAALYTALTDLVGAYGETAVADMTSGLAGRIEKGEFTLPGRRQ